MSAPGIALATRSREARQGGVRFQPEAGLLVDAVMLTVAAAIDLFAARAAGVPAIPVAWLVIFPVLVLALLVRRGMYRPRLQPQLLDDLRTIVAVTAVATMAVISVRILVAPGADVAVQAVREWVFAAVYLAAGRTGLVHS